MILLSDCPITHVYVMHCTKSAALPPDHKTTKTMALQRKKIYTRSPHSPLCSPISPFPLFPLFFLLSFSILTVCRRPLVSRDERPLLRSGICKFIFKSALTISMTLKEDAAINCKYNAWSNGHESIKCWRATQNDHMYIHKHAQCAFVIYFRPLPKRQSNG